MGFFLYIVQCNCKKKRWRKINGIQNYVITHLIYVTKTCYCEKPFFVQVYDYYSFSVEWKRVLNIVGGVSNLWRIKVFMWGLPESYKYRWKEAWSDQNKTNHRSNMGCGSAIGRVFLVVVNTLFTVRGQLNILQKNILDLKFYPLIDFYSHKFQSDMITG